MVLVGEGFTRVLAADMLVKSGVRVGVVLVVGGLAMMALVVRG